MGFGKKDKSAFSVHRSEEVMPNTLRHLVRQSSSLSSNEGLGGCGGGERSDRSDRDLIGGKSSGSGGRANLSTSVASSNSSGGGSHKSGGGGGGGSSSKSNSRKASPASTSGSRLKAASAPPSVESADSRDKDG